MTGLNDRPGCWSLGWRLASVLAIALATFTMTPERARAEAAVDIAVTTADPAVWLNDAVFDIVVSNPGTEPLSSVVVEATFGDAAWYPGATLTGPTVVVGNDDEVLDVGEQWSYTATTINTTYGQSMFEVRATAPDSSEVSAEFLTEPEMMFPADVSITTDVTSVMEGDAVHWVVSATNIADIVLEISLEGRLILMAACSDLPFFDFGEAIDRGGNGDESFDPGETWRWDFSADATAVGSYLEVSVTVDRDAPARLNTFRDDVVSTPLTVTAPPCPTPAPCPTLPPCPTQPQCATQPATSAPPSGILPETGVDETTVVSALAVTLLGAGLLIVVRRRSASGGAGRV